MHKPTKRMSVTALVIGILLIAFVPLIVTKMFDGRDFTWCGALGDTIGGITGPIISGFSAILVYMAFLAQKEANDEQIKANNLTMQQLRIDSVYSELDDLEDYADLLESQLWTKEGGRLGGFKLKSNWLSSAEMSKAAYKTRVLCKTFRDANNLIDKAAADRISFFQMYRYNRLINQAESKHNRSDEHVLKEFKSALLEYKTTFDSSLKN